MLDEPEAALSPSRQLVMLHKLVKLAGAGAQFVVSTHSPILLSAPGAEILAFDDSGIHAVRYEETETYRIYRAFTTNPDKILKELFRDDA